MTAAFPVRLDPDRKSPEVAVRLTASQALHSFSANSEAECVGGGWVSELRKVHGETCDITNLSIGAATSAMGIFRVLRGEVPDGSTIIWEYALNESNHLNFGQSIESLAYHFDWLLELCRRRRIKVLPLIFWTRPEHSGRVEDRYRSLLRRRIDVAGLKSMDAWQLLLDFAADRNHSVESMFRDDMQYSTETGFLSVVADMVAQTIDDAVVPRKVMDLDGRDLVLNAPDVPAGRFSSSAFSSDIHELDSPLEVRCTGRLLASYVIAANEAGAVTFFADGDRLATYSLQTPNGLKPPGRILKHLIHWRLPDDIAQVSRCISVVGSNPGERPQVQNQFAWRGPFGNGHRDDAYICSLLEIEGALSTRSDQ